MVPTHICDGTLDLIISKCNNDILFTEPVPIKLGTTSDHYYVETNISGLTLKACHQDDVKRVQYRRFADIDVDLFKKRSIDIRHFRTIKFYIIKSSF